MFILSSRADGALFCYPIMPCQQTWSERLHEILNELVTGTHEVKKCVTLVKFWKTRLNRIEVTFMAQFSPKIP